IRQAGSLRHAHDPRARGVPARRAGVHERRDRRRALHQPAHRGIAPLPDDAQARAEEPGRAGAVRDRARRRPAPAEQAGVSLPETIRTVEVRLQTAERAVLAVLVVGMTLLGFLQIVLRKVFSGGFLWADAFLRHVVLWVAFFGAGAAAAQNKHFGADLG